MKRAAFFVRVFCAAAVSLLPSVLMAKTEPTPWYQVDVVIFRNVVNDSKELQPSMDLFNPAIDAIKLFPVNPNAKNTAPVAYAELPRSQYVLSKQAAKLAQNEGYQVLMQKAWLMPLESGDSSKAVIIKSDTHSNNDLYSLNGTLIINEDRFFHVDANLWLQRLVPSTKFELPQNMQTPNLAPQKTSIASLDPIPNFEVVSNYQLHQKRRLKNIASTIYFDSPEFGMLLKLTPWEPTAGK